MSAIPEIGQLVHVRQRRYLVEDLTTPFNASITLKHTTEVVILSWFCLSKKMRKFDE